MVCMTGPGANSITADLLVEINKQYQPHMLLFRLNVMVAEASRGAVRSAPNGTADLIGCVCGHPVAIEVKAGRDRLREEQANFRDQWLRGGGIYIIARSAEQGIADLRQEINKRGMVGHKRDISGA
jgi:hypothetical protein